MLVQKEIWSGKESVGPKKFGPKKSGPKNLVETKKILVQKNYGPKNILVQKNFGLKRFGPKKWRSKKNSGPKRILVQQKIVQEKSCKWKYNATDCNTSARAKNWGWNDFPNNVL